MGNSIIFDIPTLYNNTNYPVFEKTVVEWSKGIGFGRTEEYTVEEKRQLEQDMAAIRDYFLYENSNVISKTVHSYLPQAIKPQLSLYVSYISNLIFLFLQRVGLFPTNKEKVIHLTAGAPGSGKTMLLESFIAAHNLTAPYIDPDAVFLKHMMKNTYQAELEKLLKEKGADEKKIRQDMYNKWRPASNFLTHIWQAYLISEKSSFIFGTTASSPMMGNTFKYYKEKGYKIVLIHISAPDQVRVDSIKLRDKTFVQTTDEDIREKGKLVPQRINDAYLAYADEIEFYYRDTADRAATHTASWIKGKNFEIINAEKYRAMVKLHNEIAPSIPWQLQP